MQINNDYLDNHVTEVELAWLRKYCNCDACLSSAISRREPNYFDPKVTALPTVDYRDRDKNEDKWIYEYACDRNTEGTGSNPTLVLFFHY